MTPTTLLLSRHGRTQWSVEGRYAGRSDIPLDEVGVEQAKRLAAWAASAGLDAVRCSPLRRAVTTAADAAAAAGVEAVVDERLRELDFGDAEGRPMAELRAAVPDAVAAFERDPAGNPLPDGEDPYAAAERAVAALRDAAAAAPGGRVLVVAHNTLLRLALCTLLGIPLADYRRRLPRIDHDALAELRLGPAGAALRSLNAPIAAPAGPASGAPAIDRAEPPTPGAGIR